MNMVYSQYVSPSWQFLKSQREKPKTADEYLKSKSLALLCFKGMEISRRENNDFYFEDIALDVWLTRALKFERVCHYFLDDGVADFLANAVKEFTPDYFRESVLTKCASESHVKLPELQYLPFFIHFPLKDKRGSIGVVPYFKAPSALIPDGYCKYLFAARDYENVVLVNLNHEQASEENKHGSDNDTVFVEKVVYGFTLYLDAFPDVVREADGVKHVGHYKGTRKCIRANDIVHTEAHHSVSPHFRRGHFRVLSSDHFKAARGKTIFINGMFVKGKAFDVLADDCKGGAI